MGLPTILPTPIIAKIADYGLTNDYKFYYQQHLASRALPNLAMLGLDRWYHASLFRYIPYTTIFYKK